MAVETSGFDRLQRKLQASVERVTAGTRVEASVVYEADYALRIHEDLEANHPNGGQAKFLEQPAREHVAEIRSAVTDSLKEGKPVEEALKAGAGVLLEKSQELVPVDTGFLKNSGVVKVTRRGEGEAGRR